MRRSARKGERDRPLPGRSPHAAAAARLAYRMEAGLLRGEVTAGLDVLLGETNGFDPDLADLVEACRFRATPDD